MADQGENYTQISNEILEALTKAKLNGTQYAICLAVVRHTFGFHRCEAKLSAGFIAEATGLNERQVKRELKTIFDRNIILQVDHRDGITSTLGFNKDISSWQPVSKKTPVKPVTNQTPVSNPTLVPVTKTTLEPVSNPSPKKEKKENSKEIFFPSDSIQVILSNLLLTKTMEHYPQIRPPDIQEWAKHIDLLIRVDKKDPAEIRAVILWAKADSFWKANIMSTQKLRKQYDSLNAKRLSELEQRGGSTNGTSKSYAAYRG